MKPPHYVPVANRRQFLMRAGGGLGALAVSSMLQAADPVDPLAPKTPHHKPTAKSVIWLFMEGGPSHIDLFDPKPALEGLAGKPMPESFGKVVTAMGTSMQLVWNNLPVMLAWGLIVLALFVVSLATGLLGLIVVFPLLGHGTWHAYRAIRP